MKHSILILLFTCLSLGCAQEESKVTGSLKISESDEFAETIVKSQFFEIELDDDLTIEGKNGTRIVFLEGSLTDEFGNLVSSNITVELAEAFSLTDMLLSNLTTTTGKNFLETGGMIYINLTSKGKPLIIDPEKPLYIEIPTLNRLKGMEVYKGIRDSKGNIDWVDPEPIQNYLIPVDMELLDFLPNGFRTEVAKGLPFRSHTLADNHLVDSLYYSLSVSDGSDLTNGLINTEFNESYLSGTSIPDSIPYQEFDEDGSECGVDPANIKVVRTSRFQKSFLATREFEKRLQTIFESCQNEVFEVYINNLEKDLWVSDSLASELTSKDETRLKFQEYAKERLTNVEDGGQYADALSKLFESELIKVKEDLNLLLRKMKVTLEKENKIAEKVALEYKDLLAQREKFRMESYGFRQSRTGWINVDIGTSPKNWGLQKLELIVSEGKSHDRIHSYLVFKSMKSLFRLQTEDSEHFYAGNVQSKEMLMPKKSEASCITIAYKDGQPFIGIEDFVTGSTNSLSTTLVRTSKKEIDKHLSRFKSFKQENNIERDMEFMDQLDMEKRRQNKLKKESEFIGGLNDFIFSCCATDGAALFEANCVSCHSTENYNNIFHRGIGGIGSFYNESWFVNWTKNAMQFAEEGDPHAKRLINRAKPAWGIHAPEELTDTEIKAIYKFLGTLDEEL